MIKSIEELIQAGEREVPDKVDDYGQPVAPHSPFETPDSLKSLKETPTPLSSVLKDAKQARLIQRALQMKRAYFKYLKAHGIDPKDVK